VLKDRYSNRELRAVLMRLAEQGREQSALCRLEPRDIEHTAEEVFAAGAEMGADRAGIEEAMAAAGEEAAPDSCAVPPPLCSDRRRDDQETSGHVVFDCNDWRTRAGFPRTGVARSARLSPGVFAQHRHSVGCGGPSRVG
jgi:hypothetical protein